MLFVTHLKTLVLSLSEKMDEKKSTTGGIVVIHSKQQLYLYDDAKNLMRQVLLGLGAEEEATGTAALLPAEGGAGGGGAGVGAAAAVTDLAALGGLGGLGPHALAPGGDDITNNTGRNRASEINLAEGADALASFFFNNERKETMAHEGRRNSLSSTLNHFMKYPKTRARDST
jgi:hypothetical protein